MALVARLPEPASNNRARITILSAEIRGELKPITTAVPGILVSELFPQLARLADKYCIVRSVTHHDTVHTSAGYTMLTGA